MTNGEPVPENGGAPNGKRNGLYRALHTLASSTDRVVQLGTLGLVAIGGVTSFFQGEQLSKNAHHERERALREIHQLYGKIDETEERQRKALSNQQELLEESGKQLKNQTQMLENQREVLELMRQRQKRFMKKNGIDEDAPPF